MVLLSLGDSMIKFENVSFAYDKNEKDKKALDLSLIHISEPTRPY